MIYVGIDPGITGGVVAISAAAQIVAVHDTPSVQVIKKGPRGPSVRREPDVDGMVDLLAKIAGLDDVRLVVLEKVQPMPMKRKKNKGGELTAAETADATGKDEGWGATPNFNLGLGYGLWWAAVKAAKLPLERVAPISWRSALLKGMPAGKGSSLIRVRELFPASRDYFLRVKDHGRADATLLAEYGRRTGGTGT